MREHSVPCVHATFAEQARHRTFNDDRVCDYCRPPVLAAGGSARVGASASERSPQRSEAPSCSAVPPGGAASSDLSAAHGPVRARVGSTASCPMPSGERGQPAGPAHLDRALRAFVWSPYRTYLAALAAL